MYKYKKTLASNMIWSFSLIFFLLLTFVIAIILRFTNIHFQEQSYDFLKDLAQSHIYSLDNNFFQLQRFAQLIANNQDLQEAVYYRNNTDVIDYSIELLNLRKVDEKLLQLSTMENVRNAIVIGSDNEVLYSLKGDVKENYNFKNDQWFKDFKRIERNSGNISFFTSFHEMNYLINDNKNKTISMLTPIPNKIPYLSFDESYILTDIDLSPTLVDATQNHDVQIGIYDNENWLIEPQLNELTDYQKKKLRYGIDRNQDYFVVKSNGWKSHDFLIVTNTSKTTGWKIVSIKSLQSLREVEATILLFITLLLFVSGIAISLVSMGISKTILNPMNHLIEKFKKVANEIIQCNLMMILALRLLGYLKQRNIW